MRLPQIGIQSFVLLALFAAPAFAQTAPPGQAAKGAQASKPTANQSKPTIVAAMMNADVVNMIGAGLSETIVMASIREAKERSFDVTPTGLIALKKAGVSDGVIAVMLNPVAAPAIAAPVSSPSMLRELKVIDGSEVRLRLLRPVSSENAHLEDRVDFEIVQELKVDGATVIEKGAAAVGRITEAQPKKSFGRSGKLNFRHRLGESR